MKNITLKSRYFGYTLNLRIQDSAYAKLVKSEDPMADIYEDVEYWQIQRYVAYARPAGIISEGQSRKVRNFFAKGNTEYFDTVIL